jgi:hypothetical protein
MCVWEASRFPQFSRRWKGRATIEHPSGCNLPPLESTRASGVALLRETQALDDGKADALVWAICGTDTEGDTHAHGGAS